MRKTIVPRKLDPYIGKSLCRGISLNCDSQCDVCHYSDICLRESLLKSHMRGLMGLFPLGTYTITISKNKKVILEMTSSPTDKDERFIYSTNRVRVQVPEKGETP